MTTPITIPCTSCGDPATFTPEPDWSESVGTLCHDCAMNEYASIMAEIPDFLDLPTHPMPYADDGIDVPVSERDELDRTSLVGDDGRDEFGEMREERAEPFREVA